MSKSGFPGLVREPINKSPNRPQKREFESQFEENGEAGKDMSAY